jgi:hypothetical protein
MLLEMVKTYYPVCRSEYILNILGGPNGCIDFTEDDNDGM